MREASPRSARRRSRASIRRPSLPPPDDAIRIVPLRETSPKEVYEVDMVTTSDVPVTDEITDMPYDEWLEMFWRRPSVTLDGSFAAIVDGRVAGFTLLAANRERGRAFTEYTATLADVSKPRNRRSRQARLAAWAAAQGIRAAWTTNDETNAAMLAVNERLGYTSSPSPRRVSARALAQAGAASSRAREAPAP